MEQLNHECGVAMIRLLKPLSYYQSKYGSWTYGLNKLYLMMEKQHNRGQEGAGISCVSLTSPAGSEYMYRERAEGANAISEIFGRVRSHLSGIDTDALSQVPFAGELYMGHLRYSTTGRSGLSYVHPFLRRNNWRAKNLCICGNFNMTNIDEVFGYLTSQGQSPRIYGDSYITLELMGHRLDREVERLYREATSNGLEGMSITRHIDSHISMANVLRSTMPHFDGGYVMCGQTGSGEMFAVRDPWGIRPAYYYHDDEIVAVASERPVLQTTFDLGCGEIKELPRGSALTVSKSGAINIDEIIPPCVDHACSFERIYFSRGSDRDIYVERKRLGEQLAVPILAALGGDVSGTVFSYIPNTAEVAFYGMMEGVRHHSPDVRIEKVIWKDIKLRTFIAEDGERNDLAAHVYDITYGSLRAYEDNLVIIDDSIVRGTTLRESIFKILDRLHPRKIVMVSSSPQIRYPDYYGIDMPRMEELCAFRAAMALLRERGMDQVITDTYLACKQEVLKPKREIRNMVRGIYSCFGADELNRKIAEMLIPEGMEAHVELVFQSIEGLHAACPHHRGDWYFTGHYPTPGGNLLVNKAFVNYIEGTR